MKYSFLKENNMKLNKKNLFEYDQFADDDEYDDEPENIDIEVANLLNYKLKNADELNNILLEESISLEEKELYIKMNKDLLNERDRRNRTALILACENNNPEIVKLLLENGADANAKNFRGDPVIIDVIDNQVLVELLLKYGANINERDNYGNTALILASEYDIPEIVKLLLENGADVNATNKQGNAALMRACENSNLEIVKLLLSNGADVNKVNIYNETALSKAFQRDNSEIKELLLQHGAIRKEAIFDYIADKKYTDEEIIYYIIQDSIPYYFHMLDHTLLFDIIRYDRFNVLKFIFRQKDFSLEEFYKSLGNFPEFGSLLCCAVFFDNIEIAKFLISNGEKENLDRSINIHNDTPLFIVVKSVPMLKLFINSGYKLNKPRITSDFVLHKLWKDKPERLEVLEAFLKLKPRFNSAGIIRIVQYIMAKVTHNEDTDFYVKWMIKILSNIDQKTLEKCDLPNLCSHIIEIINYTNDMSILKNNTMLMIFKLYSEIDKENFKYHITEWILKFKRELYVEEFKEITSVFLRNKIFRDCFDEYEIKRIFSKSIYYEVKKTEILLSYFKDEKELIKNIFEDKYLLQQYMYINEKYISILRKYGINLNFKDSEGELFGCFLIKNALYIGEIQKTLKILNTCIKNGLNVNELSKNGNNMLLVALKEFEAHKNELSDRKADIINIAKFLIKNNVDINHINSAGNTALYYAVRLDDEQLVKLLLENGADPNLQSELADSDEHFDPEAIAIEIPDNIKKLLNKYRKKNKK